jgi:rod shape-determining protein MreC
MYRLLSFLRRIYVPVIFLVAEVTALWFYAGSSVHSRARMLSVSDRVMGDVYGWIDSGENYFGLVETNRLLTERVEDLENELAAFREVYSIAKRDSVRAAAEFPHRYIVARVVRNSINKRENYLMVDRGSRDSVVRRMSVLSLAGEMVGYVESTSARNAICVSVLNTQFRASGMIKGTGHTGSISWPGGDPRMVRLTEVPKYADIKRGDTILTSGSFNFPEGILIGTIDDFTTDEARASHNIDVRLAVDMAALHNVILVESPEVDDLIELEKDILGE